MIQQARFTTSSRRGLREACLRRPRLLLVALCMLLWLPGLAILPPTDRDESRFVEATRQMLQTGDLVRIMNGTVPRNRKPIGIYWLQLPFVSAAVSAGVADENSIWPYRVPSVLGDMTAVLATFELGLTLLADRRAALLAGAMLASCVIVAVEAHTAKTDAALLGATTIVMAVLARAWCGRAISAPAAALFWVALGAAILIKGPIAPMVAGATALTAAAWSKRGAWLAGLRPAWGALLMLAVVAPWFVAIGIATHGAFFADALGGDLARKLAGGEESHGGWPGTHVLLLPLLAFPSTMPVVCGLAAAWPARRDPSGRFLLAWLVPCWLIFEAVPTKLPHYTLPLYPAVFLLAARGLTAETPVWVRGVGRGLAVASAALVGAAGLALPILLHAAWWLGLPAVILSAAVAAVAWRRRILAAVAAAAVLYAAILQFELPRLDALWIAPRVEAVLRASWPGWNADGRGLAVCGYAEPSLMFAAGRNIVLLPNGEGGAQALAAGRSSAVLVEAADRADFEQAARRLHVPARAVADVSGFNYSRGRPARLTLFVR